MTSCDHISQRFSEHAVATVLSPVWSLKELDTWTPVRVYGLTAGAGICNSGPGFLLFRRLLRSLLKFRVCALVVIIGARNGAVCVC